ncbi:DNA mismatch repair protein MutS [Clostridium sp.]|uniref:MutS-related protein n=1 Tax=Clostridium sp. TaxID=1506 RepID=UPI0034643FFF
MPQWGFGAFLMAVVMGVIVYNHFNERRERKTVLSYTLEDLKKRKRDFKKIKEYFLKENINNNEFYIDDQTWSDLEMDKVFSSLDLTLSTAGEHKLYDILRRLSLSKDFLEERNNIIKEFQHNKNLFKEVRSVFATLGKQVQGNILDILYYKEKGNFKGSLIMYNILSLMAIASMLSMVVIGYNGLLLLTIISSINMTVHYKINKKIQGKVLSIDYLSDVAKACKDISSIDNKCIKSYTEKLKDNIKLCDVVLKNSSTIGRLEGLDAIGDYLNALFLFQVRSYFKVMSNIEDKKSKLIELYSIIGEIDALSSVAYYRENLPYYSEPNLKENERLIRAKEALNPLILEGVANDITLGPKGIILTGSNMAGKSTYLRTVGINAILSQSIYTTLCKEYEGGIFRIMSSISISDNIEGGESYYLGEAKAVNRILKVIESHNDVLCFIDEIFKGTNPVERVKAAKEILIYIINKGALAMVATHDLELTVMTDGRYENYHFEEGMSETEGLSFDYKLKVGVCKTRNAIKLLKYLNYPKEIIEGAEREII